MERPIKLTHSQKRLLECIQVKEPDTAAVNVSRLARTLPLAIVNSLPNLLGDSPDPDSALNLLERLCRSATPELVQLIERRPHLAHYALLVCGYSPYLGDTLIAAPELLHALAERKELERSLGADDYQQALSAWLVQQESNDPALLLARFRRRSYVRILLRDVLGIATLADTAAEISALADAVISESLRLAEGALLQRLGLSIVATGAVAVLGLGKIGGNELNYSSDVDLLFLYDEETKIAGASNSREYFIRLAQQVTEMLSQPTAEGPAFRIDLRLRPQGREGEPAVGIRAALRYYSQIAHDWELQAMIKARHIAGDESLSREFIRGVEPYVYKQELNFAAIETAIDARRRMAQRRAGGLWARRSQPGIDVKVGRGGIRDIEFLAQCLQRAYGGSEPWLRSSGTFFALQKLHDKGHLPGSDFHNLSSAYEFLRKVEHRLQLRYGQQTHRLPGAAADLQFLYRAIGGEPAEKSPDQKVIAMVTERMAAVAEIYQRIIHQQPTEVGAFELTASSPGDQPFQQALRRLAAEAPELHAVASSRGISGHARRNLQRFLAAVTAAGRLSAIANRPRALERALVLFETSEFLTDVLIRYPEETAFLAGPSSPSGELFNRGEAPAAHLRSDEKAASYSQNLDSLRRKFRRHSFRAGACDVLYPRGVFASLAETTAAAEQAIAAAVQLAEPPARFAVLALGRLGSKEFDLASDADLLFVRHDRTSARQATRAAERVVQALAAYTSEGTAFAVDPRLRPRGNEGELVVTPAQLSAYFAREAQLWEALTYTKLRHIAGDASLGAAAVSAAREAGSRFRREPAFVAQLREMRARLQSSGREPNLKTIVGGFYDVDFVIGALQVQHGDGIQPVTRRKQQRELPERGNTREALAGLLDHGLISKQQHAVLLRAAELFLTTEHMIRLVLGRPQKWLPAAERQHAVIERLTQAALPQASFPGGLEDALRSAFRDVRAVFDRLLPAP
jgi:glutamate-ammonia-ligase adenylyltransferase